MRWRRFGLLSGKATAKPREGEKVIFAAVEQELRNEVAIARKRWHQHTDFDYLRPIVDGAKQRARITEQGNDADAKARAWLRAFIVQAPHAAQAQSQMDKHRHGFHDRANRVMELIDFNDAYVSTVLAMPPDHLHGFNDDTKRLIDWFCKRVGAWTFSDEQFEAIAHGLSREIAVYNAVKAAGFGAEMTTRSEDAFGIDIHIIDRTTGRRINVDIKTASAFHYRLIELLSEGRISDADMDLAETRGYAAVYNSHDDEKIRVVLWRIDHETLGNIQDFAFANTEQLIRELGEIFTAYGE